MGSQGKEERSQGKARCQCESSSREEENRFSCKESRSPAGKTEEAGGQEKGCRNESCSGESKRPGEKGTEERKKGYQEPQKIHLREDDKGQEEYQEENRSSQGKSCSERKEGTESQGSQSERPGEPGEKGSCKGSGKGEN